MKRSRRIGGGGDGGARTGTFLRGRKGQPSAFRVVPPITLQQNARGHIKSETTGQQVCVCFPIMTGTNGGTLSTSSAIGAADLACIMNSIQQGNIDGPSTPDIRKTGKVFLQSFFASLCMTNNCNAVMKVKFYDCVTRRNTDDYPDVCWDKGIADQLVYRVPFGDNKPTAYNTFSFEGPSTNVGSRCSTYYGAIPTTSKQFNAMYKVKRMTTKLLSPGQVYEHTVRKVMNRMYDCEELSSYPNCVAGLTYFTMIVVSGFPDRATDSGFQVTTASSVAIDWIFTKETRYKFIRDQNSQMYTVNNLFQGPSTTTNGGANGEILVPRNAPFRQGFSAIV